MLRGPAALEAGAGAGGLNGDCSKSLAKLSRLGGPAAKQAYDVFQWVEV